MLNNIIHFSIKNKFIVGLFVLTLIFYGSYQATKLPIDAVPDITNNQVQVIAIAPSLGALDIERLVTFPIELANSNIPGLHEIRSFSRFGLSVVTIVFDDDKDIYWARQQVNERIQKITETVPKSMADISLGPITTGLGEIYQYTLRAAPGYEKKYDITQLRTIQDWIVRRQLLGVKGVAEVNSFGGKLKQFEIAIEPNKLKSYNITIEDVFKALENNNQNTGGAYIEKGPTALYIRSEGLIGNLDDIRSIFIKSNSNGTPLLLGDVATVAIGYATRYGALCYNDEGEVTGGVVMMLKGENGNTVVQNIKERIEHIKKTLPQGLILEPFLDRSKLVSNSIHTVTKNLMEGALIVLFVLIVFLGNFRAGFLVASVIPLSMLVAIILMNLFGVSGNLMSLGALDFGLIIDGAVIIVEAVLHSLHAQKFKINTGIFKKTEIEDQVYSSASKMLNSAVFGQLIILVVYLPIFFLEGIEGKMFRPMVQTIVFALIGAFILSLTYIPMMSALIMSKKMTFKKSFSDTLMSFLEKYYQLILLNVLKIPKLILGIVLLLFLISITLLSKMGGEFIPTLEEGDFALEIRVLPGSNLNTTIERTQKIAHILLTRFPEVTQVVTKIGSGEVPNDPMPMELADMMVILKDKKDWSSAHSFTELSDKMGKELEEVPGISISFQYPIQMRFNELMTGAKQEIVCKIFGDNLDTLSKYAQQLGHISRGIEGAQSVFVETVNGLPEVLIHYNRGAIAQYGLNIHDINKIVNTALAGQSAGLVYQSEQHFDLVVRLKSSLRTGLESVSQLLINTPSGDQIPLNQLARVEIKAGPYQIQRENAQRRIIVGFNSKGRDIESIVNELQKKTESQIKLPSGYYITYGGTFENLNKAKKRLGITVPVSLFLIFLLLYFAFGSVKQSLLIYTAIPLSIIGGIIGLSLRGFSFSISAGIGFIALFGVAVLNGIVLIAEFNRLKQNGINQPEDIVIKGGIMRLRPILMTATVASLGFLPMALSTGIGSELQRPLATVVISGLLIATLLTLFVLPILYIIFEKWKFNKTIRNTLVIGVPLFIHFMPMTAKAQDVLNLKASLDTAIQNNLFLKKEKLNSDYYKKLKGSAWQLDETTVSAEYGQFNSIYNDTKLSVSQSLKFPNVYIKQKDVLKGEWEKSNYDYELKKRLLIKEVSLTYYHLEYLKSLKRMLLNTDSLFAFYEQKAVLKYEKGESNVLEKNTAMWQRTQINIQLRAIENDYEKELLDFNLLLNSKKWYEPDSLSFKAVSSIEIKPNMNENHPLLSALKQEQINSKKRLELEKSLLLPSLFAGYNTMSIMGNGPDNVFYNKSHRFQSIQAGIGVPLFFNAQKSRISAQRVQVLIADNIYQSAFSSLQNEYKKALKNYDHSLIQVQRFEEESNPMAEEMLQAAQLQFEAGSINYLEWMMLHNQIIDIKTDYLKAVNNLNNSIIEINYFNSK